ncbi:MAG: GtrA family protein [Clostridia bacterium]|nr:GtrA family protein [Clostridia bacterium]
MKELIKKYKEVLMYLIFGGATTFVNWLVYVVMVKAVTDNLTVANAVAWVIAVSFAFVTNKLFVFESKSWKVGTAISEFVKFIAARVATGVIDIFLPSLLFSAGLDGTVLGIEGAVAKAIASIVVIILNYVFSKLIVFRKKK